MSNGKGDTTRPPSVPRDTFAANWDRTFNQWPDLEPDTEPASVHRVETDPASIGDWTAGDAIHGGYGSLPLPDSPDAEA